MRKITLTRPDDWHLHLRDNEMLTAVVNDTARQFARAIIMPNLVPPVTTCNQALLYRDRIMEATKPEFDFNPLMTLYLTDNMDISEIKNAKDSDYIHAAKLYPAGATTNSDAGVTHIDNIQQVLETMQQVGLPLLVHGEATDKNIDIFDKEKVFIDNTLVKLRQQYPELRIVFEHITTSDAVDFILSDSKNIAATITPHHLLINRNDLFIGGINPHHYCLPIAKREQHRLALLKAATETSGYFFAGTDSAPHTQDNKESACGCAGIYSAYSAIELYAEAFDQADNFTNFESFMSLSGPAFYKLPINTQTVTLLRKEWTIPNSFNIGTNKLIPFKSGQTIHWELKT